MTVGRRQYNEAEMMQMQREAEARVREMQERARQTVEQANQERGHGGERSSQNRNWSSNAGMQRQRPMRWPGPGGQRTQQRRPQSQSQPRDEKQEVPSAEHGQEEWEQPQKTDAAPAHVPKKGGTIVGDIMDALNLDEDYLLIIGLILILINQRADTTLILALAYLLF